jgi:hypothetical protein
MKSFVPGVAPDLWSQDESISTMAFIAIALSSSLITQARLAVTYISIA